jgi:periplasmic divalent cation tolerance protein
MDMRGLLLVMATFPDLENARRISRQLVEERLVACVNLLPQAESIYRWKGAVEVSGEVVAVIKTTVVRFEELRFRFKALHPYEVPELVALEVVAGLPDYLRWVVEQTEGSGGFGESWSGAGDAKPED